MRRTGRSRRRSARSHRNRGAGQPQAQVGVKGIGGGLSDRRRKELDGLEEDSDFRNFAEQLFGRRHRPRVARCRCEDAEINGDGFGATPSFSDFTASAGHDGPNVVLDD